MLLMEFPLRGPEFESKWVDVEPLERNGDVTNIFIESLRTVMKYPSGILD
jgi:hypothetical protein